MIEIKYNEFYDRGEDQAKFRVATNADLQWNNLWKATFLCMHVYTPEYGRTKV
jgi:hypothetical protein